MDIGNIWEDIDFSLVYYPPGTIAPDLAINGNYFSTPTLFNGQWLQLESISSTSTVNDVELTGVYKTAVVADWEVISSNTEASSSFLSSVSTADIFVGGFGHYSTSPVEEGADLIGAMGAEIDALAGTYQTQRAKNRTPTLAIAEINRMNLRAIPNVLIEMPTPVQVNGIPVLPRVSARTQVIVTCTSPSINTDPDDDDDASHVWRVGTLDAPDDSGYPLDEWEEVGGGLKWYSAAPYRPRVRARDQFLTDNTTRHYSRTLHFNHSTVDHMWLDLGEYMDPMTVLIAAVFHGYADAKFGHYALDSGRETPIFEDVSDGKDHKIDDNLDYRATLLYKRDHSFSGTSNKKDVRNGRHLRASHNSSRRPKVLFTVFNHEESMHGSIDPKAKNRAVGTLGDANIRHLVLGRARNRVDHNYSCHMTVFEVRIYDQALTWKQIKRKAKKMGGRYKFNKYWD